MGNEINGVSNNGSVGAGAVNTEPDIRWTSVGLKISNIKKGDQIRISDLGENKYLFVNDRPVFRLDNSITYDRLIVYGTNLNGGDIAIQGENGVATTIELRDSRDNRLSETYVMKSELKEEKGPIEKIVEAPIKAYPFYSKGAGGVKFSGTW